MHSINYNYPYQLELRGPSDPLRPECRYEWEVHITWGDNGIPARDNVAAYEIAIQQMEIFRDAIQSQYTWPGHGYTAEGIYAVVFRPEESVNDVAAVLNLLFAVDEEMPLATALEGSGPETALWQLLDANNPVANDIREVATSCPAQESWLQKNWKWMAGVGVGVTALSLLIMMSDRD
jgi:hypothetical protein